MERCHQLTCELGTHARGGRQCSTWTLFHMGPGNAEGLWHTCQGVLDASRLVTLLSVLLMACAGKGDVVAPALFVPGNAGTYHQVGVLLAIRCSRIRHRQWPGFNLA
jgi:hypothetical protein